MLVSLLFVVGLGALATVALALAAAVAISTQKGC